MLILSPAILVSCNISISFVHVLSVHFLWLPLYSLQSIFLLSLCCFAIIFKFELELFWINFVHLLNVFLVLHLGLGHFPTLNIVTCSSSFLPYIKILWIGIFLGPCFLRSYVVTLHDVISHAWLSANSEQVPWWNSSWMKAFPFTLVTVPTSWPSGLFHLALNGNQRDGSENVSQSVWPRESLSTKLMNNSFFNHPSEAFVSFILFCFSLCCVIWIRAL